MRSRDIAGNSDIKNVEVLERGESVKIEYREREIPVMEVFTELMKEYQQKEGKDNE